MIMSVFVVKIYTAIEARTDRPHHDYDIMNADICQCLEVSNGRVTVVIFMVLGRKGAMMYEPSNPTTLFKLS